MFKNHIVLIVLLLFAPLILQAQTYLDLRYDFQEGEQFQIHQKGNKETYLTVGGLKQRTTNNRDIMLMLTIQKVRKDGSAEIAAQYKSIVLSGSQEGSKFYVDTKSDKQDVFNKLFKGLINKNFTIVISEYGEVKDVSGMKPIFNDMVDGLTDLKKKEKPKLKDFLLENIGPQQVKFNLALVIPYYPPFKVHSGDAWTNHVKTKGLYNGSIDNYWKLTYGNKYMAKLKNNAKFYSDLTKVVDFGAGQTGRVHLKGDINSEYVVDVSTSWPKRCIVHSELKGEFTFLGKKKDRKRKRGDIKVPVRIVQNINYEIKHF